MRKQIFSRRTSPILPTFTHHHPVGVGVPDDPPMQFPAATLLRADASIRPYSLWPSHSKSPTCTLSKNPSPNLSKKPKKVLTSGVVYDIIFKLSRGGHAAKSAS